MLPKHTEVQSELEFVCIEDLVPSDHLLRKISSVIDFSFIRSRVSDLYCSNNGRPAVDPVVLFKIIFIGYLFGIRSERQLIREIEVNLAYRWFLGLGLRDKVPDASTLSQNRRRRFSESTIYQEIFDEIVFQAIRKGLVDGNILYTDSTHLKANANKNKFKRRRVTASTKSYLADLEESVSIDRQSHGKKPLKKKDDSLPPPTKDIKASTTDPDSGYMVRDGKPRGFFYLDHRTVDGQLNIITDTYVTPATVHDSVPYLDRLDHQRKKFDFDVAGVGLDAGYFTAAICKGLVDRDIFGVIGYRRPNHKQGFLPKRAYKYDSEKDCYICPGGEILNYRTTTRPGYREYVSNPEQCKQCEHLAECTHSRNHVKVVTRHVWQDSKEAIDANRLTERGKALYRRRKETVERSFADAKQLHGHRYAKMRGLNKVREQCLLSAACQNMKKIALAMTRGRLLSLLRLLFDQNRPLYRPIFDE